MLEEPMLKKKRNFNKRYLFFSIIGIFLFIGISYGLVFFIQEYQSSSMGMTTDLVTIDIEEYGYIKMDSAKGQKDEEGLENDDTEFKIVNNNKTPIKVTISFVEDETSTMSSDKVRFALQDFWHSFTNIGNLGENNNVLGSVNIGSGVEATIYANLWLDYYYEGVNETFSGKYKVEVSNIDDYAPAYLKNLVGKNKGLYAINNDGTLNDGTTTDTIVEYRYSGLNPDNYIKYNNDIWRILGIDYKGIVKIVKDEPLETTVFGNDNNYSGSTAKVIMNEYYENSISDEYKEMIFKYGVHRPGEISADFGTYEANGGNYYSIALLNAIDYFYSTDPAYYNSSWTDANISNNTWLTGTYWTMTEITDTTTNVLAINNNVPTNALVTDTIYSLKPCLYLDRDVSIISGDGTKEFPYEIDVINPLVIDGDDIPTM